MALIDIERSVLALCFREQPSEAVLEELGGDRRSWLLYRHMVRERLLREIRIALPRSYKLLGAAAFAAAFRTHLDRDPPRTRFFREIVAAFVNSALPLWQADPSLPAAATDLVRYEAAVWEVGDLDARESSACVEFAFDRIPVASRALRLLTVSHAVHELPSTSGEYTCGEYRLAIHRAGDTQPTRTWTFTPTTFALLQRWQAGVETVSDSVQSVCAERGIQLDAKFVDGLCGSLAQLIELGIVLGSRA